MSTAAAGSKPSIRDAGEPIAAMDELPVKPPRDKPRSAWSRLYMLIGDQKVSILSLGVASILAGLAEAGILAIAAQAATSIVNGTRKLHLALGPVSLHTTVGALLIVAIVLAVVRLGLQLACAYYPAVIGGDAQARLRRDLFAAYTDASWNLQSQGQEGHFQEMMTNQITLASAGAFQATMLLVFMFTFLVLAVSAFALNVIAAITVLGAATLLFVGLRPLTVLGQRMARRLSAAQIEYAGSIGEATSISEETQVFGIAVAQRKRVDSFIGPARGLFVRTQLIGRAVPNLYQGLIYVILIVGLLVINFAHAGGFSSLGAVVLLLVRAGSYGQLAQGSYQYMRQALPYIERIQDATARYRASRTTPGTSPMGPVRTLALEEVSYAYRPDRPVLSELSFEVTGGETIGVVGPSGAGKSTLVQILLRLRPPASGRYLINGVSAEEYDPEDWTRRVGYVPQQPRLVYASVADNVRFFRPIDDEAVERACRLARIHDEIITWPHGYDTIVGPRADAVSGGQQQRICLARALAARPELLVLDEPTSALDPRSEALIQDSLVAVKKDLTLFIIAHRMSTLNICDRVMVILDGKLDAFDSLEALRRSNEYYRFASSLSAGTPEPESPRESGEDPTVTEDVLRGVGRWWWSRRGDRT